MSVSWSQFASQFVSGISADASTIALDLPGSGYDRLHDILQRNILPQNPKAQIAVAAIGLIASRLVQQQLGSVGPVGNYVREVAEDGVREEVKRILERVRSNRSPSSPETPNRPAAIWEMDAAERGRLMEFYGSLDPEKQQRLREYLLRATMQELATMAGLPHEHRAIMLEIVSPPRAARQPLTSRVSATINDACRSLAEVVCPWTAARSKP